MDYNRLAELLYPHIQKTPEYYEEKYPARDLPEGACVTRLAPSPTGFIHLGNFYGAMVDERIAHQSGGVLFLRIEDTDSKREVENGVELIVNALKAYDIQFDEGETFGGAYGPYRQSERAEIYQTYAKKLVSEGKAYPCFCTEQELEDIRTRQETEKLTPGYYGKFALWRDRSIEDIEEKLKAGEQFVLRFRCEGSVENKFKFTDLIKGTIDVTENHIDHVLLKSDGIPTYHFAHAVDDHLMRTTHVVRDESWLSSLPFHIQLFKALGFKMPKFCHTAQVMKLDNGNKRKLSKRKDPECGLAFYRQEGYCAETVREYVMTLLNSNFEEWRMSNTDKPLEDFKFSIKKMSPSGCLFDFDKLNDVSKNTLSRMSAEKVYELALEWYEEFDCEFAQLLKNDRDYAIRILSIGRGGNKPRKDITVWKDVRPYMDFFYDELFAPQYSYPENTVSDVKAILEQYKTIFDEADDRQQWFDRIKELSASLGYAAETKAYKKDPDAYKGHVGDISMVIRVAVTGRQNSPDMYDVMQILGKDRIIARIDKAIEMIG